MLIYLTRTVIITAILFLQIRRLELMYRDKMLTLIKAFMDLTVGVGLLKVTPKVITPRIMGVLGFLSSLISCYKVSHFSP